MESGRPYSRLLSRLERAWPLSLQDRRRVAELPLTVTNINAHEEISHQGDVPSRYSLLLGGFLFSHKLGCQSRRQITSFAVPGDIADLHTLHLSNLDHSISSLGPAVVAFLPRAALEEMMANSPSLSRALWHEIAVEGAISREWITSLGRREAIARVAHMVCELVLRLQAVNLANSLSFSIPWTQAHLADACGISSVHANRVIQELRRLGLVAWDAKQVKIYDWDGLVKVAGFSENYLQLRRSARNGSSPGIKTAEERLTYEKFLPAT